MEKYLLIDVVSLLFLTGRVLTENSMAPLEKLLFIALYLLFYYVCLWHRDWRLLAASFAGWLLLAFLAAKTETWILMYGFAFAHLLGRANHKVMIGAGMVGIVGMFALYAWIGEGGKTAEFRTLSLPMMIGQLVTPIIVSMRIKANVLKEKLDIANKQLERYIQEEERNRIARDLHDTLGQTLTMIKLKSELALRYIQKNPDKVENEIKDILNSSRYALKQVGELVTDMKRVSLEQEMEQSRDVLQKAGVEFQMAAEPTLSSLSPSAETMLALSLREAVTNIIKHSGASRCVIKQYVRDEYYYVEVSDNGNGNLKPGTGNGLQSMKERMAVLQGEVMTAAKPNEGTTILFKVPLKNNRRVTMA